MSAAVLGYKPFKISGIIVHTFEIKSNLIFMSNPIRADSYPKCKKPIETIMKRKLAAPPVWAWDPGPGPGLPGPRPWGAVGLHVIVFSIGFLYFGILGMHMPLLGGKLILGWI